MDASSTLQTPSDVDAIVSGKVTPVLIDCYAPVCGPCAAIAPVLDELAGDMQGRLAIEKIDVSAQPEIARRFGVRGVPTLLLFQDGQLRASRIGAASRTQLLTWLSANGAV